MSLLTALPPEPTLPHTPASTHSWPPTPGWVWFQLSSDRPLHCPFIVLSLVVNYVHVHACAQAHVCGWASPPLPHEQTCEGKDDNGLTFYCFRCACTQKYSVIPCCLNQHRKAPFQVLLPPFYFLKEQQPREQEPCFSRTWSQSWNAGTPWETCFSRAGSHLLSGRGIRRPISQDSPAKTPASPHRFCMSIWDSSSSTTKFQKYSLDNYLKQVALDPK